MDNLDPLALIAPCYDSDPLPRLRVPSLRHRFGNDHHGHRVTLRAAETTADAAPEGFPENPSFHGVAALAVFLFVFFFLIERSFGGTFQPSEGGFTLSTRWIASSNG